MKIGFDAKRIVSNGTGLGSYGRTLVNSLAPLMLDDELMLYAPDCGRYDLRSQVHTAENMNLIYPQHGGIRIMRDLWRTHGIVKDLIHDDIQVFHGLSGELPHGLHKAGVHGVVTIHDLIFMRHPEYYNWIDTKIYAWKFRATIKEAERIIAISECTKRDIMYFGGVPEDKISVVYQSCATTFGKPVDDEQKQNTKIIHSLPDRFILSVGTIEERKNAGLAIKALRMLPDDVHLVLVGRRTKYTERIVRYANANKLNTRVHILNGISNDDLHAIYQMAECFVYPSRYEGFGIPIIEAIQSGLPVVACTGSCLEEAGGPDCLYVDPDDDNAMADAVGRMLHGGDMRERSIVKSREYVRRFENNDIARQMISLYHQCMEL